jgi:cell division protein FtsQ
VPVSAPADRRFRRARVSPARRSPWRGAWKKAAGAVLGLAVTGAAASTLAGLAASSGALTVSEIAVSGNERISSGEVHALLEGVIGGNMLTLDLDRARLKLLASPWVATATLRRVFPGSVSVVLSERRAAGIGRIGGTLYLIDRTGTVIDEFGPNYAELDLPIIDGLAAGRSGALMVHEGRAALVGRLLADLEVRPDLAARVSQIDVTDVRDAVVVLKGDTTLVRLGTERFLERLQSYVELAPVLREEVPDIDHVDLRYDERVYVMPQRTGASAPAALRRPAG